MQRLLTLVFLMCLAIPAGISFTGCVRNPAGNYCNGEGFGLKLTDVASIVLTPQTSGISLAFGQTQQISPPRALTCKGVTASVGSYTYGTTNNQLVDISPSGNLCGGTWNRRSGGGIPDFTICNKPDPLPSTSGLPYGIAYVTATGASVTSNQVAVYVHPQVTSVSLVLENPTTLKPYSGCVSQSNTLQLDAQAYYLNPATNLQTLLCEPGSKTIPNCSAVVGTLSYDSQNPSIASIDQYGVITAELPGTTYITASVSGSGSSAGYFSTCPPASIGVTLNGKTGQNGQPPVIVTQGVSQNLVTTIVDTNGNPLTGLTLDYQSTNPLDISAGSGGAVTANFAGEATIYAVCQPTTCNPAPIDKIGLNGTGTPITSNPVTISTPGVATSYYWVANPNSQYFIPVELLTGTLGSTVKMPYFPNSMMMDQLGTSLYFGTQHELMIYSTSSNGLTKEDPNVPGVVLAVSPNNQTVLINDQVRRVFYLYGATSGTYTSFSGVGTSAQWTPDAKTLYIVGTDYSNNPAGVPTLFVNNVNTGWTTYPLTHEIATPSPTPSLALAIPGVGAFLSGQPTVAHAWCPDTTVSVAYPEGEAYPLAASLAAAETDVLASTTDGQHILGVGLDGGSTATLYDINPGLVAHLENGACPAGGTGVSPAGPYTPSFVSATLPPSVLKASVINQVVPSPASNLAFITYQPLPGATVKAGQVGLPYYAPDSNGTLGTIGTVPLAGAPTAPLTGAFSLDDTLFFVSTDGDDMIHYIDVKTLTDSKQINPGLTCTVGNPSLTTATPCQPGTPVPATFIAVKPRTTT